MIAAAQTTAYARYAVSEDQSRGRRYDEAAPAFRSQFQRDRDRIIHCSAFRRLEYKTQVFVNHEGDMFRTRLTHSLEVAQIARVIARALRLNEDLTETIALAHDLGHTPFGHAGQHALNQCMHRFGGFEHNVQSLRVVDSLEQRYPDFAGLNLLYESREGILKHCSHARARKLGDLGRRFIEGTNPSLEAQLANLADEIAYNHHDIDDGLRANLLNLDDLLEFDLFEKHYAETCSRWQQTDSKKIMHSVIRAMLNHFVHDLIVATQERLAALTVSSLEQVRQHSASLVGFSAEGYRQHVALKRILRQKLYRHPQVLANANNAGIVVSRLFDCFFEEPSRLPQAYRSSLDPDDIDATAALVADYVAGMTDRFAIAEHERLFGHRQFPT